FLKYFLQTIKTQPSTIALIIQKEVAKRIIARDNKESILSISVKAYGTPHYVEKVPRKLFSPEPNVDSAIISIKNISKIFFEDMLEEKFFTILKAGFAHKRKMLKKNLGIIFPKEETAKKYLSCEIPENARAENLSLEKWKCIVLQRP
ncbi:MAG: rRNA adenine N-6-methyltransferase family protein, partial [bacterium]|nr:rRNA adenine N-6-methyltransferase family protein [bacterium]